MKFDRDKFFAGFRQQFGALVQSQVDALEDLLTAIEEDDLITDIRHVAYILATTFHETAATFQPIHEYGSRKYFIDRYGGQTALGKRLGNDTPEEGATYAGRGFVQLTGEYNYETAEKDLRSNFPEVVRRFEVRTGKPFDLTVGDQPNDAADADNAMNAEIAYFIMSNGMRLGRFTGKKLKDYIDGERCDYYAARRIINVLDKAATIAGYARRFEVILKASALDLAADVNDTQLSEPDSSPASILPPSEESPAPNTQQADAGSAAAQVNVNNTPPAVPPVVSSALDSVAQIASTGMGKIGQKITWGTLLTGLASAVWGALQTQYVGIIIGFVFAIFLIGAGVTVFVVAYNWGQKKKIAEAQIRSDPTRYNVSFEK